MNRRTLLLAIGCTAALLAAARLVAALRDLPPTWRGLDPEEHQAFMDAAEAGIHGARHVGELLNRIEGDVLGGGW